MHGQLELVADPSAALPSRPSSGALIDSSGRSVSEEVMQFACQVHGVRFALNSDPQCYRTG